MITSLEFGQLIELKRNLQVTFKWMVNFFITLICNLTFTKDRTVNVILRSEIQIRILHNFIVIYRSNKKKTIARFIFFLNLRVLNNMHRFYNTFFIAFTCCL